MDRFRWRGIAPRELRSPWPAPAEHPGEQGVQQRDHRHRDQHPAPHGLVDAEQDSADEQADEEHRRDDAPGRALEARHPLLEPRRVRDEASLLDALADRIEEGRLVAHSPRLEQRVARLERTTRRITSAVLFVGLFIGGILLRPDEPVWGGVLIAVSVIPLLHALFAGVFRQRGLA